MTERKKERKMLPRVTVHLGKIVQTDRLICVDFCFHPDIFDVVLHLKSVKLDGHFATKMKLHTSFYLCTAVRI